jgi:hypothetical protein
VIAPTRRRLYDSAVADSTGFVSLDLGGPALGYSWEIRTVAVTPPDLATIEAAAGPVYLAICSRPEKAIAADVIQVEADNDSAIGLPVSFKLGQGINGILSPEHLAVWIFHATPGNTYTATAHCDETRTGAL